MVKLSIVPSDTCNSGVWRSKNRDLGSWGRRTGMRKMRARKAKGRQAHLGACTMPRVTLEEHPAQRWWRKHHCAGHEGQQQREQGGLVWLPTVLQIGFRAPGVIVLLTIVTAVWWQNPICRYLDMDV